MAEKELTPPPEGCKPMFIQAKYYETYGLFSGESRALSDVVTYKLFNKVEIEAEIEKMGFMCDWHSFMKDVADYPGKEILVLSDVKQVYGDSWLACFTEEAKAAQMETFEAAAKAEKDRLDAIAAEEARLKAEEEAAANAVFEDKPMYARPYVSANVESTIEEVAALRIQLDRPLFGCNVGRPLHSFGHVCSFGDRDADNEKYLEFRKQLNPDFDLERMLSDIGLQAGAQQGTQSTQTTWYRPVNKAVQYTTTSGIGKEQDEIQARQMSAFLRASRPVLEEALQQNETVEIFGDAFTGVGDEESAVGSKGENDLKELRTFNDIVYSKNMSLSAIDWHPKRRGMLAVAPTRNLSFDARIETSGQAYTAYILIWDFVDLIHPQLMLQSPHEILTFRFNKSAPHIVAAGCLNGQVLIWDIKDAMAVLSRQQHRSSTTRNLEAQKQTDGNDEDEDSDKKLPPILPLAVSHIDGTHKRMVAALHWLPPDSQINNRGQVMEEMWLTDVSYQFITVSGDGQCLVWDTRYQEIAEGLHPHIAKVRAQHADKPGKDGTVPEPKWNPLFRMQLKRLEGVGELSLCCSCIGFGNKDESADGVDRRSQIFTSTEEGEIVFADWRPPKSADAGGKKGGEEGGKDDDEGHEAPEYVQWMAQDHARPAVALERSPFFKDIVMSVGDWNFQLWKLDHQAPIFTSPASTTYLTKGCWSPTRPGMLFMARADGLVDVWDLTDSSYRPSVQLLAAPTRITSMEFLPPTTLAAKQQLLAVGDMVGNLHVFDVPRNLWRSSANEKNLMDVFLTREVSRVQYVAERMKVRREEDGAAGDEDENDAPAAPVEGVQSGGAAVAEEVEMNAEELAAAEAEYKEVEAKLMEELGFTTPAEDA